MYIVNSRQLIFYQKKYEEVQIERNENNSFTEKIRRIILSFLQPSKWQNLNYEIFRKIQDNTYFIKFNSEVRLFTALHWILCGLRITERKTLKNSVKKSKTVIDKISYQNRRIHDISQEAIANHLM